MRQEEQHAGRNGVRIIGAWRLAPIVILYCGIYLVPMAYLLRLSLYRSTGYGTYAGPISMRTLQSTITSSYGLHVLVLTCMFGLEVLVICVVLGYPLAIVVCRYRRMGKGLLVLLLIASFSIAVVKALGWVVLLGYNGPINRVLVALHIVGAPVQLVYNLFGAVVGTAQAELPYMVLMLIPFIASAERLREAGETLGASEGRLFRKVTLPLSGPGLLAGSLLVFATTMASYTTPAILGGPKVPILPLVIETEMTSILNYPLGAAFSVILLVVVFIAVVAAKKVGGRLMRTESGW